jgi:hypothetical protein
MEGEGGDGGVDGEDVQGKGGVEVEELVERSGTRNDQPLRRKIRVSIERLRGERDERSSFRPSIQRQQAYSADP